MSSDEKAANIYIIGAGVSGLVAAINLEKQGYAPTIIEASDSVGGRVRTDIVDGYQLDRGFQVLLDAYPMAQKYLDYEALELQKLSPGALLFENGKSRLFGDPLRDSSFLFPTLLSNAATLSDKWKIFQLKRRLEKEKLEDIFKEEEKSTLDYLNSHNFSERTIRNFFKPFFSGIFLEDRLATSSRMFRFVYKMFGEGNATIPKNGIGAIPEQLRSQLANTEIKFNTRVEKVSNDSVTLSTGESLPSDFTIIATDPTGLVDNYVSSLEWKSCDTLYFSTPQRQISKPIIGLSTSPDSLVNNIFFASSIESQSTGNDELLSVTIVKDHDLSEEQLVENSIQELKTIFDFSKLTFLACYQIKNALPIVQDQQLSRDAGESQLTQRIALSGDYLLSGSLNAAMSSGEAAANVAHRSVSGLALAL